VNSLLDYHHPDIVSLVQKILELVHGPSEKLDPILRREYKVTIDSIIIEEKDMAERFVNHLWYTIIDQRRDVKDFVIPMMTSLMLSGFNPDYVLTEPAESLELLSAILTAYGHELKYSTEDNDKLKIDGYYRQRTPSRSESVVKTIQSISRQYGFSKNPWHTFKQDILKRRSLLIKNDTLANRLVREWPFVSSKSFKFFLRDIEPMLSDPEGIPIPIDSNVAQSIQKTGLMFDNWPPNASDVIPVSKRGERGFEKRFAERVKSISLLKDEECGICDKCDKDRCHARRMVYLAQTLFLLGAEYCQRCYVRNQRKIVTCPLNDDCMLSKYRDHPQIHDFIEQLEETV
jgi:hypothetical protein